MTNRFEDAALILRELKEDVDRRKERRTAGETVNIVRVTTASGLSIANITTSTNTAGSWQWGTSEYDHDELGD